jgi:hypothetical protein
MDPSTLSLYLTITIVACMIIYAGVEGTLRVFVYLDLQLRYAYVRIRMWMMKKQLENQLVLPSKFKGNKNEY